MRKYASIFAVIAFATVVITESNSHAANPVLKATPRAVRVSPAQTTTNWTVSGLCSAYNFPTKLTGGGVIGIAEFGGGFLQSDLDLFSKTYMNSVPINAQVISVDGTQNSPGIDLLSDLEVTLDIEIAAAAYYYSTGKAPTIKVFFAGNGNPFLDPFCTACANTITTAVNNKCDVLSISWGGPENGISNVSYANLVESAAISAAAKGMITFCSSGDGDSTDQRDGETDGRNHLSLPSSCPHVVSVGGTSKTSTTEVVWNNGGSPPGGTGGGYSILFPVQSWQIGAPIAPTTNNGKGRMNPDISANADPYTGYTVIFQGAVTPGIGGTSCSCPLWAGMMSAYGTKLGFVTPTLWLTKNRSAFVDITQGNNGLFTALAGPDACTGVGVPNGALLDKVFAPVVVVVPPTPSYVMASYNTSTKTLSLVGDANANTLTVTYSAGSITVEGAKSTSIQVTGAGSSVLSGPVQKFTVANPINVAVSLGAGNDAVSFVNLTANNVNIVNGTGTKSVSFTLSNVTTLTTTGWAAATDTLITTLTTIGTKTLH